MFEQILPQMWMSLPKDIRDHLVEVFDIKKTGITEIRDQEVVRDGYEVEDLKAITHEKMTDYIGSKETFPRAWELTCMKAKHELNPPMQMSQATAAFVESTQAPTSEQFEKAVETLKEAEIIKETNATETKENK